MVLINSGRNRVCKNSVGGINKIYLFSHINYSRSQIVLNNNVLTSYPATTIYEFEVEDMPVTVAVDSQGTSVHQTGPKEWKVKIAEMKL